MPDRKYELIEHDHEAFEVLAKVRKCREHDHWKPATVALAWLMGEKSDQDGKLLLGKLKISTELEREQGAADAVVLLNREAWATLTEKQREALVDHELCHGAPSLDKNLEQARDGAGRLKWRKVKHDVEEFRSVVRRHGVWLDDVRGLVEAALAKDPQLALDLRGEADSEGIETTVTLRTADGREASAPLEDFERAARRIASGAA